MAGENWATQEVEILRENYATHTAKELISLLPRRTPTSINLKAMQLDIANKRKLYSKEEDNLARKMLQNNCSFKEIAKKLGRTVCAISARNYNVWNIAQKTVWTSQQDQFLKDNYSTTPYYELAKQLKHSYVAIRVRASRLGLRKLNAFRVINKQTLNGTPLTRGEATDLEKGIVIGLLEGEGCLSFYWNKKLRHPHPDLSIGNTNLGILIFCKKIIGGTVGTNRKGGGGRKTSYSLKLRNIILVHATLEHLLPHLLVKRKAAELMIEYCKIRLSSPFNSPTLPREREIYEEMKNVNK